VLEKFEECHYGVLKGKGLKVEGWVLAKINLNWSWQSTKIFGHIFLKIEQVCELLG
jgi:hypothetical protein